MERLIATTKVKTKSQLTYSKIMIHKNKIYFNSKIGEDLGEGSPG